MKKIVLNDTNIIIDLMSVDIFDSLFHLPWEAHITDMVRRELKREQQFELAEKAIERGCLLVDIFTGEEVEEINERYERIQERTNLSPCDCSVWYASEKRGYTVLTGDKKLRNVIEECGIEVHGILYVIEEMQNANLLSPLDVVDILDRLQNSKSRLPQNAIDALKIKMKEYIKNENNR